MQKLFNYTALLVVAAAALYNLAPLIVVLGSSVSPTPLLEFPPRGVSFQWYERAFANPRWLDALLLSLIIAVFVAAAATIVCFLAALAVVRSKLPGKIVLEMAAISSLILPNAVVALVLFRLADITGLLGQPSGIFLAHLLISIPFAWLLCVGGLYKIDLELEEAAMALGAAPWQIFRRVTLPLMKTPLLGSFLFTFLMSFDEATVAMFLRGLDSVTLPVAIYMEVMDQASPLVSTISVLLILLTLAFIWLAKRLVGLQLFYSQR